MRRGGGVRWIEDGTRSKDQQVGTSWDVGVEGMEVERRDESLRWGGWHRRRRRMHLEFMAGG